MIDWVLRWLAEDDCHQNSQKKPDPSNQKVHVVTGGAEDGIDRIAFGTGQVVSFPMPIFLQMSDYRLDHCPAGERVHSPGVAAASAHLAAGSW